MSTEEKAEGLGETKHDKEMVEKSGETIEEAMSATKAEEATGERPEWLPEKYKDVDAFLKGHKELEQKLGSNEELTEEELIAQEESTEESDGSEEFTEGEEGDATVSQDPMGDILGAFHQEYAENGELAEESYEALESIGFSRELVDTYINGYQAQIAKVQTEAHEIVGSEEEYNAMAEWAVETMTDAQLESYHQQLQGDEGSWELALRGLHAKYKASGDAPIERIRSGEKPDESRGITPFGSQEELTTATSSKEYKTSPEFRKKVEARLAISDAATMGAHIPQPYMSHG